METKIRVAKPEDLPAIVDIYNQAVPTYRSTADTTPVTVEARKKWFDDHDPDRHPIFIAELDGRVIGWCSLSVYRPGRAALRFTAEISYYVDTAHQGQGVGQALIRHAVEASPSLGIKNIIAVLLDRNEPWRSANPASPTPPSPVLAREHSLGRVNTTGAHGVEAATLRRWRSPQNSSPASSTACPSSAATSA